MRFMSSRADSAHLETVRNDTESHAFGMDLNHMVKQLAYNQLTVRHRFSPVTDCWVVERSSRFPQSFRAAMTPIGSDYERTIDMHPRPVLLATLDYTDRVSRSTLIERHIPVAESRTRKWT